MADLRFTPQKRLTRGKRVRGHSTCHIGLRMEAQIPSTHINVRKAWKAQSGQAGWLAVNQTAVLEVQARDPASTWSPHVCTYVHMCLRTCMCLHVSHGTANSDSLVASHLPASAHSSRAYEYCKPRCVQLQGPETAVGAGVTYPVLFPAPSAVPTCSTPCVHPVPSVPPVVSPSISLLPIPHHTQHRLRSAAPVYALGMQMAGEYLLILPGPDTQTLPVCDHSGLPCGALKGSPENDCHPPVIQPGHVLAL